MRDDIARVHRACFQARCSPLTDIFFFKVEKVTDNTKEKERTKTTTTTTTMEEVHVRKLLREAAQAR